MNLRRRYPLPSSGVSQIGDDHARSWINTPRSSREWNTGAYGVPGRPSTGWIFQNPRVIKRLSRMVEFWVPASSAFSSLAPRSAEMAQSAYIHFGIVTRTTMSHWVDGKAIRASNIIYPLMGFTRSNPALDDLAIAAVGRTSRLSQPTP